MPALTGFRIDDGPTLAVGYRDQKGTLQELRVRLTPEFPAGSFYRGRVDESQAIFDRWIAAVQDLRREQGLG